MERGFGTGQLPIIPIDKIDKTYPGSPHFYLQPLLRDMHTSSKGKHHRDALLRAAGISASYIMCTREAQYPQGPRAYNYIALWSGIRRCTPAPEAAAPRCNAETSRNQRLLMYNHRSIYSVMKISHYQVWHPWMESSWMPLLFLLLLRLMLASQLLILPATLTPSPLFARGVSTLVRWRGSLRYGYADCM